MMRIQPLLGTRVRYTGYANFGHISPGYSRRKSSVDRGAQGEPLLGKPSRAPSQSKTPRGPPPWVAYGSISRNWLNHEALRGPVTRTCGLNGRVPRKLVYPSCVLARLVFLWHANIRGCQVCGRFWVSCSGAISAQSLHHGGSCRTDSKVAQSLASCFRGCVTKQGRVNTTLHT